ncbi:MAG: RNA polymerase sigma factor [Clostridia bacterium]|nr:RNA polymerase sigma factor [Clostridia bacterium]
MTSNTIYETKYEQIEAAVQKDYKKLYGTVYRMTENHQDTEDILQNTFLKAYRHFDGFKNQSSLSTWIYKIAINESYRHMKSWNKLPVAVITKEKEVSEEIFFSSLQYEPDFDDELIMEEMREKCLRGFLRCIPKHMRVCFLLKTCLELKNREIAKVMDITEENVKVTLFRARKKLKELFEYRCSLIDPEKPCQCYLWIKYMRDNHLPLPSGHMQFKNEELRKEHFRNMTLLKKINYLYHVEGKLPEKEFFTELKKIAEVL